MNNEKSSIYLKGKDFEYGKNLLSNEIFGLSVKLDDENKSVFCNIDLSTLLEVVINNEEFINHRYKQKYHSLLNL